MHILLICDAYPPEVRSASLLTFDFANALIERGHRVTVATGYPRYNLAAGAPVQYREETNEGGVRVLRIQTLATKKVSKLQRGFGELLMPAQFASAVTRAVREPVDAIEVYSPPLPLALAGYTLKLRYKCPLVLNVQDLFPENAVDLGMLGSGPVLWGLLAMERMAYGMADAITVHSPGNRDFLIKRRGQGASKVTVISNWVDMTQFAPPQRTSSGPFRIRYGLEGQFVILFAGVLGPAQGLETVLDAAWQLKDVPDLKILLVGDGTEKAKLQARCAERGQTNVQFEHFVSKDDYPLLLAECDVGLVSITGRYHTPVVPGKLLGYMAGATPVLAALNAESDGHSILAASRGGLSIMAGDVSALAAAMLKLRDDPAMRRAMGERGREYAQQHFDRGRCVGQYEHLFQSLTQSHS